MKSLKKHVIISLADATGMDVLRGTKLVLVTALGTIIGTVAGDVSDKEEVTSELFFRGLVGKATEEFGENEIIGNDGYILLNDVTIKSSGNTTYNLESLVVFYDQIIGVSIGNIG